MSNRPHCWLRLRVVVLCLLATGAALVAPTPGHAAYIFSVDPATATLGQGDSQQFYVYLRATTDAPAVNVSGYTATFMINGATAGVGFTSAGFAAVPPPAHQYIFGTPVEYTAQPIDSGGGPAPSFVPPSAGVSFTDTMSINSSGTFDFVTLSPGDIRYIGVATLTNVSSPGGQITIAFTDTSLFDNSEDANFIPGVSSQSSGPITLIAPAGPGGDGSPVPAPPTLALWAGGVFAALGGRFLRLRRRPVAV